jgi:Ca2+-binding RTX toxin-like protein
MKPTLLAAALAAACLAVPATASAGTVSSDGSAVVFTGTTAAESLLVDVDFDGNASFSGSVEAGPGCQPNGFGLILCPLGAGGLASMTLNTGGGDDHVKSLIITPIPPRSLRLDLGDGNDTFIGQDAAEVVDGGAGDDDITTFGGDDELLGGDGVDKLSSGAGADVLRGGPGNDRFSPDIMGQRGADVIDGGPGIDAVDDWVPDEDPATASPAGVSLDGQANDGFAGEGDNVTAIEAVQAGSALVFSGDGEANRAVAAEAGGPSRLDGNGGDDILEGGDSADRIDGGAGADTIKAGFGPDTIVPGPGRDAVDADRPGRCNEMHCDISPGLSGDTVEARDGDVDQIACGPGVDTVRADRQDVVGADCEKVVRGGSAPQGRACVVPQLRGLKLKAAKRRLATAGCKAKVRRAAHRKVKPGRVIKASAKAGKRLPRGAKVTLTVSRGRAGAAAIGRRR